MAIAFKAKRTRGRNKDQRPLRAETEEGQQLKIWVVEGCSNWQGWSKAEMRHGRSTLASPLHFPDSHWSTWSNLKEGRSQGSSGWCSPQQPASWNPEIGRETETESARQLSSSCRLLPKDLFWRVQWPRGGRTNWLPGNHYKEANTCSILSQTRESLRLEFQSLLCPLLCGWTI